MAGRDPAIHPVLDLKVFKTWMPGTSQGMTVFAMTLRVLFTQIPQHRLDRLALVRRQSRLGCDGIADLVSLDREPGLDAGCQVVARKRLVQPQHLALKGQR